LDDVKRNVLVVEELVDILSGEQRYLQRKLERHIKTCVSGAGGAAAGRGLAAGALGSRASKGQARGQPTPWP
jgi:hypothetical protein